MKARTTSPAQESKQPASRSARRHKPGISSAFAESSPEAIAQRQMADSVRDSPHTVSQRRSLSSAFGDTAQLKRGPGERVSPGNVAQAMQLKAAVLVNDDAGLEHEA